MDRRSGGLFLGSCGVQGMRTWNRFIEIRNLLCTKAMSTADCMGWASVGGVFVLADIAGRFRMNNQRHFGDAGVQNPYKRKGSSLSSESGSEGAASQQLLYHFLIGSNFGSNMIVHAVNSEIQGRRIGWTARVVYI